MFSAIITAIGQISTTVGSNINLGGKAYNDIRKQEGVPLKKDWFGQYKTDNTKQYYIIFLVLTMAIILAITAMAFSKSKD